MNSPPMATAVPNGGLVRDDKTGNLFGTTVFGGKHDYGTVFKLTPEGQETVLHSFKNDDAGKEPVAGLVRDSAGNLYGAASYVLFRVSPTGAYDVLHELSFD